MQDAVPWLSGSGGLELSSNALSSLSAAAAKSLAQFALPPLDVQLLLAPKGERHSGIGSCCITHTSQSCGHNSCGGEHALKSVLRCSFLISNPSSCSIPLRAQPDTAGLEELLARGMDFLVEKGRIDLANEFLKALTDPAAANFGVLLSGPNGIGKWMLTRLRFVAMHNASPSSPLCVVALHPYYLPRRRCPDLCRQERHRLAVLSVLPRPRPPRSMHSPRPGLGDRGGGWRRRRLLRGRSSGAECRLVKRCIRRGRALNTDCR